MNLLQNKIMMYICIYYGYNMEDISRIYINEKPLDFKVIGNFNKILHLGKFDIGEHVKVEIESYGDELEFVDEYIYYEDKNVLDKYYDVLSKEQMEIKEISGRCYEGEINIESNNEYVMLTIPYDEGWNATVDGKNSEILKVQDGFMAIKVPHGKHIIKIQYIPSGLVMGACLSVYGVLIFAINIFMTRKRISKS